MISSARHKIDRYKLIMLEEVKVSEVSPISNFDFHASSGGGRGLLNPPSTLYFTLKMCCIYYTCYLLSMLSILRILVLYRFLLTLLSISQRA
jgi:hypothetical protein